MLDREKLNEKDKILICKSCGKEFAFLESEKRFYNKMGFTEPKHCWKCRQARKEKQGE